MLLFDALQKSWSNALFRPSILECLFFDRGYQPMGALTGAVDIRYVGLLYISLQTELIFPVPHGIVQNQSVPKYLFGTIVDRTVEQDSTKCSTFIVFWK